MFANLNDVTGIKLDPDQSSNNFINAVITNSTGIELNCSQTKVSYSKMFTLNLPNHCVYH